MEEVMGMRSMKSSASKVPMEVSKTAMGLDEAAAANCLVIAVGRVTRGAGSARPAKPAPRRVAGRTARARDVASIIEDEGVT